MKKAFAIWLCLALLLSALPGQALAATDKSEAIYALKQEASRIYRQSLATAEKESFTGLCGLMVSHQLWNMGINSWLEIYDGNQQFDAYAEKEQTSGGYFITAYPASEYTLEESLNIITQNGTRDVYNVLVGFEWTNTEAGGTFGHVVVINGIIDGMIYFVESFHTSLGGEEGNVIECSIKTFCEYFSGWVALDGVIHFSDQFADGCQNYDSDIFVRARYESFLRSEPCLVGEHSCANLRTVSPGERLRATGVYKNNDGDWFYQIQDGEYVGYIAANAVKVMRLNGEDLHLVDVQIPTQIAEGERIPLSGNLVAENASIDTVKILITDASGNVVMQANANLSGKELELAVMQGQLGGALAKGAYNLSIQAQGAHAVVRGQEMVTHYIATELLNQPLIVGDPASSGQTRVTELPTLNGWVWDGTTWYYYRDGAPYTGWLEEYGVKYYLKEDGSVTTDWAEVDGIMGYFTQSGALCVGWLTTEEGVSYHYADGSSAVGVVNIGGIDYYFDENGFQQTDCTVIVEDRVYEVDANGIATAKDE